MEKEAKIIEQLKTELTFTSEPKLYLEQYHVYDQVLNEVKS